MSSTERCSRAAATSSLSSPVSVSATACPTSVMLTTCRTPMPFQRKARRSVSANTYGRMLPRCGNAYTVGPQLYMPAVWPAGTKSSIRRPSELNSRSWWLVDTILQRTGAGAYRGGRDVSSSMSPGWLESSTTCIARLEEGGLRRGHECLPDDLQRMPGRPAAPVRYLLPAGNAGRGDDRVLRLRPDGGEEPELADAHRQFVVLRLEAERPGHSAAPGVHFDDVGTGDAAQQGHRRGRTRQRLLVAVAVEHDAAAAE